MRSQQEINHKINLYKQKLVLAIEEKDNFGNKLSPDIDLIIFSLIDKLEALLWVLGSPLPGEDILDNLSVVRH